MNLMASIIFFDNHAGLSKITFERSVIDTCLTFAIITNSEYLNTLGVKYDFYLPMNIIELLSEMYYW